MPKDTESSDRAFLPTWVYEIVTLEDPSIPRISLSPLLFQQNEVSLDVDDGSQGRYRREPDELLDEQGEARRQGRRFWH